MILLMLGTPRAMIKASIEPWFEHHTILKCYPITGDRTYLLSQRPGNPTNSLQDEIQFYRFLYSSKDTPMLEELNEYYGSSPSPNFCHQIWQHTTPDEVLLLHTNNLTTDVLIYAFENWTSGLHTTSYGSQFQIWPIRTEE